MMMTTPSIPSLWLASRSPRRRWLLEQSGVEVEVSPPDVDDGELQPGMISPIGWTMALAYLKARRVADSLRERLGPALTGSILAADTVCAHEGRILGQPDDIDEARDMLRSFRNTSHQTITGVCLLDLARGERHLLADAATVHVGAIPDDEIERYLATGEWRGKAGAYNLIERQRASWPIDCDGDPATVMGLPMRKLTARMGWPAPPRESA